MKDEERRSRRRLEGREGVHVRRALYHHTAQHVSLVTSCTIVCVC